MAGHGAGVNVVDRYDGTPALDALRHRHADVLAFLRAHGARLPAEGIKGARAPCSWLSRKTARVARAMTRTRSKAMRRCLLRARCALRCQRICATLGPAVLARCLASRHLQVKSVATGGPATQVNCSERLRRATAPLWSCWWAAGACRPTWRISMGAPRCTWPPPMRTWPLSSSWLRSRCGHAALRSTLFNHVHA